MDDITVAGEQAETGAVTQLGVRFGAPNVVPPPFAFLNGLIHVDSSNHAGVSRQRPAGKFARRPAKGSSQTSARAAQDPARRRGSMPGP